MSEQDALKIHEARERAELAHADKTLAPVSLAMAILAVELGALSMLGHRAHSRVLLAHTRANFWKAELVGNKTREHADVVFLDMLDVLAPANTAQAVTLKEKIKTEVKRYQNQEGQDTAEGRRLEVRSQRGQSKANRFDLGELFCELGACPQFHHFADPRSQILVWRNFGGSRGFASGIDRGPGYVTSNALFRGQEPRNR
jgi:hypothetical protein